MTGGFRLVGACVVLAVVAFRSGSAQSQETTASVGQWRPFVLEAAQRFDIPVSWIERVIRAESGGHIVWNGRPITSRVGAMGLMQLMPDTYADMRKRFDLGSDPYDPHDNILAGTAYLRLQFDQYGYPGLFAAYNAGPGRYEASLKGQPLPLETRNYLVKVTQNPDMSRPRPGLFVDLSGSPSSPEVPMKSGLFVPHSGDKSAEK